MIHHEGSDKIYMSEEMIGAYLEGKLASHDARYVESLMAQDDELASLIDDCLNFDSMIYAYSDGIEINYNEYEDNFTLPKICDEENVEIAILAPNIIEPYELLNVENNEGVYEKLNDNKAISLENEGVITSCNQENYIDTIGICDGSDCNGFNDVEF